MAQALSITQRLALRWIRIKFAASSLSTCGNHHLRTCRQLRFDTVTLLTPHRPRSAGYAALPVHRLSPAVFGRKFCIRPRWEREPGAACQRLQAMLATQQTPVGPGCRHDFCADQEPNLLKTNTIYETELACQSTQYLAFNYSTRKMFFQCPPYPQSKINDSPIPRRVRAPAPLAPA